MVQQKKPLQQNSFGKAENVIMLIQKIIHLGYNLIQFMI